MYDGRVQVNRYDAEGLRHEMEENGQLVTFLYSGREVVAEESETTGILRYIRGYELISSDSESARTYYHYVGDEDGSITHVVGGQEGTRSVLNRYEYDAFGNYQIREESVHNRFGYNGELYDPVTGQYYLRARYYNPVIGRFTQEDTYYGDGLNLYAYCHNNPVGYEDPSGHYRTICDKKAKALEEKEKNGTITKKEQGQLDRYRKKKEKADKSKRTEVQRKKWEEYTGTKPKGEVHHGLPEELSDWFASKGIDVNSGEFYYDLPKDVHRLKEGNGIHTNSNPLGKNWNAVWDDFMNANPNATKGQILAQLKYMEEMTGIGKYKAKKK